MQESLIQQEGMLGHDFEELSTGLLLTAASQALRLDNGQLMDQNCWASPDTFGKLDTLCALCPAIATLCSISSVSVYVCLLL